MINVTTLAPIVMSLNVNKFYAGKVADDFTIKLESAEWSDTFQSLKRLQLPYQTIGTTFVTYCNRSVLIEYYDIKIYFTLVIYCEIWASGLGDGLKNQGSR